VVDVRDDGEVADMFKIHRIGLCPRECKCKKVNDVERKIYRVGGGKSIKRCKERGG